MLSLSRLKRAAQRYIATGKLRSAPGPMLDRFFGGRSCFFVQVGSNDGVFRDPLHNLIMANPDWRGLFIEPMDEPFARLRALYSGDVRFAFERLAVADAAGYRSMYCISPKAGLSEGMSTISSFSRSHVLGHLSKLPLEDPASCIEERQVRCEPLMSVLDRYAVKNIDIFHVDAETYDYQVLRQLDFGKLKPRLILYEHCALTPDDRRAAEVLLAGQGYRLVNCRIDTLAIRRDNGR